MTENIGRSRERKGGERRQKKRQLGRKKQGEKHRERKDWWKDEQRE